ncbi:N-acyl amino acid synthase FeeM domain-containing protein [Polaromonas sp. YR568]|uniref:N-acyl amino acid synthase FeeM domain-containing protein n=1 Tax=Polaromonas sp. YR568 TaxID=1855301 RepID=UPI00398BC356
MFAFEFRRVVIGTLRLVPMHRGLTSLEKLLAQKQLMDPEPCQGHWEIGRLVLNPDYRSGPDLVKKCVFLGVSYFAQHTDGQDLFASCSPVLSRLYRRFGLSTIVNNLRVDGTDESYVLMRGRVSDVLKASAC